MNKENFIEEFNFIDMAEIDYRFMLHIKSLREGKFTQEQLSEKMGVNKSFVGNVESLLQHQKYGTRHITLLAKAFGFKTTSKLLNFPIPSNDIIRLELRIITKLSADGSKTKSKQIEVMSISPALKPSKK